jgi:hypothetical protein
MIFRLGHVAEVRFEAVGTQCSEIMNGSNGGLNRTVKTTIFIDCHYRSWPFWPIDSEIMTLNKAIINLAAL